MSYTYDELCRVCKRRTADLNTGIITDESFTLDVAGNILDDHNFEYYSANNRLEECTEYCLEYDEDGNMTYSFVNYVDTYYTFDSRNRLVSDGTHTYTYNAENTRIRSTCDGVTTYYTYNTNAKLSQLLHKQTQGVVTKYVYGLGLIGEEKQGEFKTYHFDYRGSTVAITDRSGIITDTFRYDTYGKLINRTGETDTPFLFNGRDGVMTEENGLYYMRARYYSPDLRRFINADIVAGEISNSPTLNRYAYANGNPVSLVDPLGLSAERGSNYKYLFFQNSQYSINNIYFSSDDINYRPYEGEPGSTLEVPNGDKRTYGPDGKPVNDYDHDDHGRPDKHPHDENGGHQHDWKDGVRGPAHTFSWDDVLGVLIITASVIGTAYLVANNVSGFGVADDFLLGVTTSGFAKGLAMIGG